MRWTWLLVILIIGLLAGCAADGKKSHSETQKESAKKQWAQARAKVMYGLARDQYALGNFAESRKTVDDALKLDFDNGDLWILSAKLGLEQNQLEISDKSLAKAREIAPKNPEVDYLSGVVYQRWQKPDKAYEFYSSAVEKAPTELAYLMAKSEMLVAMDRQPEALQLLQEKVVYFEHSAVVRDAVGQLLMQAGKYKEAAEMFRKAAILSSADLSLREHLGLALFFAGNYGEAAGEIDRLCQNPTYSKRADLFLMLGQCQAHMKQTRQAKASFEKSTQLDGSSSAAWLNLGRVALQLGDTRRADIAVRKALTLDSANAQVHLLLGYVRFKQGKKEDALSAFRKASALDEQDTVSLCMIGYVLEKLGRGAEAMKYYAQALKIRPGDELATKLMSSVDFKE